MTSIVFNVGLSTQHMTNQEHLALMSRIGTNVSDFNAPHLLTMPIATFVQSSPGVKWHMLLLVAVPLAFLEWLVGGRWAATIFLLSDWISEPMTSFALWAFARAGSSTASRILGTVDTGSSAAAHGAIGAICVLAAGRWRVLSLAALFSFELAAMSVRRFDVAVAHLLASLVGIGIAAIFLRNTGRRA